MAGGGCAGCDLCLLPGACKFSIPHIDPSSVLQPQEIKIPVYSLELSALLRKEHGKNCLFGAYRNPSDTYIFLVLTEILHRYIYFLSISYEHELKYPVWVRCCFS